MNNLEELISIQNLQVSIFDFFINLLLAAAFSYILGKVYVEYGESLSNRHKFSRNFILLTMTTMVVITIVKSSLALSLGLVGALSIVRFRAPIKEPEELSFLFLSIAIGLGLGADQRAITTISFFTIVTIIYIKKRYVVGEDRKNIYLTVSGGSGPNEQKIKLNPIVKILKNNCTAVDIRRIDEDKTSLDAMFIVEFDNLKHVQRCREQLFDLYPQVSLTFLDNSNNTIV